MVLARPSGVPSLLYNVPSYAPHISVLSSSQESQKPEPTPRRITSNVKQNLMYLKLLKEFNRKSASSSPKPATSYRKKKVEKIPDDIHSYEDPTLKLYHTNEGFEMATPVLLVDGYNLCGYWTKLKKSFSRGDLDTARQKLIDEMINFSAIRGVKVVVVFDAMLSGLSTHKETTQNVDVVYTVSASADSWIEKEVSLLRADGCPKVWVVSSDTFHQHAAYGAGAYIWNCRVLISEIKEAKKQLKEMLHDDTQASLLVNPLLFSFIDEPSVHLESSLPSITNMYSVKGKLLEHNLDPEVLCALQNLKQQLKSDPG